MQEKRQYPRIEKKFKSEVHSKEAMTYSTSGDVSYGGIFISTPEPVTIDSEVNLSIFLPDGGNFEIKGVVKWICDDRTGGRKSGMGIEFTKTTEEQQFKLKEITEN